jgi:hypothetical protein
MSDPATPDRQTPDPRNEALRSMLRARADRVADTIAREVMTAVRADVRAPKAAAFAVRPLLAGGRTTGNLGWWAAAVVAVVIVAVIGGRSLSSSTTSTAGPTAPSAGSARPSGVSATQPPPPSSTSGPTTGHGLVPWVDRPAPSASEPSPSPLPSPDARPCQPSDVRAQVGGLGLAMGNSKMPVSFVNVSSTPCALVGVPSLVGITAAGVPESILVTGGGYFPQPGPPANLAPNAGVAVVDIDGAIACPAAIAGRHRIYKVLRIGLPGGGTVDVDGSGFETICGVSVSAFGTPTAAGATDPPLLPLSAQISGPSTVAPGTTLTYVVTITNTSDAGYVLDPCPVFEQFVASGSANVWVATIRDGFLNCDTVHGIPAHGAVTYEMRLAIPSDQPAGDAKFGWSLRGDLGPWANAPLRVQPGP